MEKLGNLFEITKPVGVIWNQLRREFSDRGVHYGVGKFFGWCKHGNLFIGDAHFIVQEKFNTKLRRRGLR